MCPTNIVSACNRLKSKEKEGVVRMNRLKKEERKLEEIKIRKTIEELKREEAQGQKRKRIAVGKKPGSNKGIPGLSSEMNKYLVVAVRKKAAKTSTEMNKYLVAAVQKKPERRMVTPEVSSEAKEALLRRRGDALVKQHGYGCRHYGILDLPSMSQKRQFDYYCMEGRWFHEKSCLKCHAKTADMKPQKGSGIIVYYCEMGIKAGSINAEKEEERYDAHTCDCVLCPSCHAERLDEHQQVEGQTGRFSRRNRG